MGDDRAHETDDVDGSCFVSKSPAGDSKMGWDGCAARLEFHHMISPALRISYILRPFFLPPSTVLRPKTCAKSIARQGPSLPRLRSDLSTAIPHSPTRPHLDDHGSHKLRQLGNSMFQPPADGVLPHQLPSLKGVHHPVGFTPSCTGPLG